MSMIDDINNLANKWESQVKEERVSLKKIKSSSIVRVLGEANATQKNNCAFELRRIVKKSSEFDRIKV